MRIRLITLGVLLLASCSSGDDGPEAPVVGQLPSVRATVQTSGRDIPVSVTAVLCEDSFDASCQYQGVSSNGEVTFDSLAPGRYYVQLSNVAPNCSLASEWIVGVPVQDTTVTVGFAILCRGPGTARVSAVTSGTNPDLSYSVLHDTECDDYYFPCNRQVLLAGGTVEFSTSPGAQTFRLEGVASNCAVVAPGNPASVVVVEDGVVELRYEVACQ